MLLSACRSFSLLLLAATLISVFVFWSSLSNIPNQIPREWTAKAVEHKTAVIGNVLPLVETTEPVPTNKDGSEIGSDPWKESDNMILDLDAVNSDNDNDDRTTTSGQGNSDKDSFRPLTVLLSEEDLRASLDNTNIRHLNLTSRMTSNGNYFPIVFDNIETYNPNVIPHPYRDETYIVVAQRDKQLDDNPNWYTELVCEARFQDSQLKCVTAPMNLPIAATATSGCRGRLDYMNLYIGPHDARVFYGPEIPYIIYGSQSNRNCLGQWIQDLRRIVDWGVLIPETINSSNPFFSPVDIERTGLYDEIEKNYFPFWDLEGTMYMHFDLTYKDRAFSMIDKTFTGGVGINLAPLATTDSACMAQYFPRMKSTKSEWIHQSSNSLSITLCARSNPDCRRTRDNTYILTIVQHKTFYNHGVYEPYVILFSATAPFALHAISSKPFWIPGRGEPYGAWLSDELAIADPLHDKSWVPKHQSQMIFIVSLAWKAQGMKYHGYLDDELFISFGVEDQASGGIVVTAQELLVEMNYCDK